MPTLRDIRLQKGWTQAQLANKSDVSTTTVSNAERGLGIQELTARKLCKALEVEFETVEQLNVLKERRQYGEST